MRVLVSFFLCAMLMLGHSTTLHAQAANSYQSNQGWGTGSQATGAIGAIMHNQLGTVAQREQQARRGDPFSTNSYVNQTIGVQNNTTITGNNNATSTNQGGTNTGSTLTNRGTISTGSGSGNISSTN